MKTFLTLLSVLFFFVGAEAQQSPGKNHSKLHINCITCHTCGIPTKDDPCWVACPREKMITVYLKAEQTADMIVIDEASERYGPVYFPHKIHAQMSVMLGGCGNCHHHNTLEQILKCQSCHEASRKRENISVPDLRGAYHRQCVQCHREWSHETGCNSCHIPIHMVTGSQKEESEKKLAGKLHPPVTEPIKIVYETNYDKGKFVTYYHNDHIKNFKLNCSNCHAQESCTKCHDVEHAASETSKLIKGSKSLEEHHQKCFSCHAKDNCTKCHADQEKEPFNHEKSTGWALNRFHFNLACDNCHDAKESYKKLDPQCVNCHKNWSNETFKHSVTGLRLNEPHESLNCEDCHIGKDFAVKPSCIGCHENFSYPKQTPGTRTGK
jgi:hypothetical protein